MRPFKNRASILTTAITMFFLVSCSPTNEERVIMDFEQNINGTKTDLSMKIKTLEKVGVVTAADSATILDEKIKKGTERRIGHYKMEEVNMDWLATNKIYKSKPDSVLLTKYKCTYTIKNPFLNNVEQELTKLYHISNSGKIVLSEKL